MPRMKPNVNKQKTEENLIPYKHDKPPGCLKVISQVQVNQMALQHSL